MTPTGRELLTRLLEATPSPPAADTDIDQLLATFDAMLAQRAAILAEVEPPLALGDADRPLLDELDRLQRSWQDVLGEAMRRVGGQRCGAGQLRAYAGGR